MIRIDRETPFSADVVAELLRQHLPEQRRKQNLMNYYEGKHIILERTMNDPLKPNNRLVHPYANYITKTVVGYFMGEPVVYQATEEHFEDYVEELQEVFEYNDDQKKNVNLAKDASIAGAAHEMVYIDNDKNVRYTKVDVVRSFPVYTTDLEEELLAFVRYYDNIDESKTVEVSTETHILTFKGDENELILIDESPHPFKMVPVVIYRNNEEQIGDYELVVSLIDAIDRLSSDSVNDFEQFADAYLVMEGLLGTDDEDVLAMRENKVLLLPEGAKVDWLIKQINDTYFQNVRQNLANDIHKFTSVPDMADENFGSNLSGIAIKYKLLNLENIVSMKEAYFKDGLQRRIELMTNYLNLFGTEFSYLGVDIHFRRNLPVNELELVDMANKLIGLVSDETAVAQLPFVGDPAAEIEKRDNQITFDFGFIDEQEQTEETDIAA